MTNRLVNWNTLNLTISGEKASAMIGRIIAARKAPISSLFLEFREGELLIEGKVKKGMTIPFEVTIREIRGEGSILHIRIHDASAFGLPVPALIGRFLDGAGRDDSMRFDGSTNTLSVDIGKKTPPFIDVTFDEVKLVSGGIELTLGEGGVDVPEKPERSEAESRDLEPSIE